MIYARDQRINLLNLGSLKKQLFIKFVVLAHYRTLTQEPRCWLLQPNQPFDKSHNLSSSHATSSFPSHNHFWHCKPKCHMYWTYVQTNQSLFVRFGRFDLVGLVWLGLVGLVWRTWFWIFCIFCICCTFCNFCIFCLFSYYAYCAYFANCAHFAYFPYLAYFAPRQKNIVHFPNDTRRLWLDFGPIKNKALSSIWRSR